VYPACPAAVVYMLPVDPAHAVFGPAITGTGRALMVIVNALPVLPHPLPLVTVSVPVYVPATTPAAIGTVIGLAGNAVDGTFTSPAASAAAFHVML
jgi:hypothetical protein